MNDGPVRDYLDALARELRVRGRYRRRILEELAAHIDDAVADATSRGASTEDAERRALDRLGGVHAIVEVMIVEHRESIALLQQRRLRLIGYAGAALVLACVWLSRLVAGDSDGHLGLELTAALTSAIAVLAVDSSVGGPAVVRGALVVAVGVWIATLALLLSAGDVAFCLQVLAGVLGAAAMLVAARNLSRWSRRGAP